MLAPKNAKSSPIAVLGAGDLVSHLRRTADSFDGEVGSSYSFNVFREASSGRVTHSLNVDNLSDLLSLCYVLAFAILDDGWVSEEQRDELQQLITKLDSIRQPETDHDG